MKIMRYLYSVIVLFSVISVATASQKYNSIVFPTESKYINDACVSDNGSVVLCTDNNNLKAFSVHNKQLIGDFSGGHKVKILCVAMSKDSSMVASGGSDSTVVIWDYNTHQIIQRIAFGTGKITCIKFSPDNQYVLFGCSNSPAYYYSIKEQRTIFEFTDQKLDVNSVAFSQDGKLIAIASGDKIIRIYNTVNFQLKSVLRGHKDWVRSISFYNNGQKLISVGDDKKIIQWDLSTLRIKKIVDLSNWILCVDIENNDSFKSNLYVVGTMNGMIKINNAFGYYKAKLNFPISRVLILPNSNGYIEIAVATLGSGLMFISASDMEYID